MNLPNIHPGEVLLEEFLNPMSISQNRLAREISVPPRRINEIVLGKRSISADTAVRLARFFDTSENFWMGLQADYDIENAQQKIGQRNIDQIHPIRTSTVAAQEANATSAASSEPPLARTKSGIPGGSLVKRSGPANRWRYWVCAAYVWRWPVCLVAAFLMHSHARFSRFRGRRSA